MNKEESNDQEWEGRIKAIAKSLQDRFETLKAEILSRIKKMTERDAEATRKQIESVERNQAELKENMSMLKEKLE